MEIIGNSNRYLRQVVHLKFNGEGHGDNGAGWGTLEAEVVKVNERVISGDNGD